MAAADDCTNTPTVLLEGITAVEDQLGAALASLPFGTIVQTIISTTFRTMLSYVDGKRKVVGSTLSAEAINLSFAALKGALSLLSLNRILNPILTPVINLQTTVQTTILNNISCFAFKGYPDSRMEDTTAMDVDDGAQSAQPLSVGHCAWIARTYHELVSDAIARSPAMRLPEGSSGELRRLAQGSLDTLELMQKYSVASNLNLSKEGGGGFSSSAEGAMAEEFVLTGRPLFAGHLLDQYMIALVETVLYALTSLGLTVNMSNALEGCLLAVAETREM
ncbi:hypothetical protein BGX23_006207 [Mortierella sp. AD031]|nr:hypothetical protein BGX23_006207 [Mortierella sp. AD031]KAG0208670.1 hypothetical protein BGX33_006083 [Mortierella sp. NVP41]